MEYKDGGRALCVQDRRDYDLISGKLYQVVLKDGRFSVINGKYTHELTEHVHFWPWKYFKPYEEFQIKTEEDYYTWLAKR